MICNIDAKQLERTVAKTFTDMANMALDTNVIDIDGLIKKMNTDVNKSIEAGGGEIDPTIGKTYAMLVPDIVDKLLSSNHSEAINLFLPARVDSNRIKELRRIINEGGIKAENEIDKILAQGPVEDVKSTMDYVNSPFAISLRRQQKVSEKNEAKTSISRNVKKIINTLLNKLFGVSDNPIKKTVFSSIVYSPESNVSDFLSTFDNVTNPVMSEIMEAMSSDTKLNEFKEKYNGFNIKLVSDKHIKKGEFSNKVLETIKNKKNKEEGFWLVAVNDKGEVIKFNEDGSFNPEGTENFVLFANKPNNINAIKDLQNYYADIFGYRSFAALSSLSKQQGSEGKKAKKIKEDIDQFISEETKKYEKLRERASKDNDVVLDLIGINRGNVTEIESDQSLSPNNKSEINFNKIKESLKEKGKQAVLTFVSKISGNDTFGIPDGAAVINIMEGTSVVDVIKLERPRLHQVDIDVNGKKEGLNSVIAKIVANEYEIGSKFGSSEWINNATTVIGKYINTNDFHLRINDKGQVEFFVGRKGVMHLKPGIPVTEKNYQPILELIEKIDGIRDTGIEGVTEKQLSKVGVQRIGDSIRIDNVYYHIDTLKVHFNNSLANGQGRLISIEGNKVVENDLSYADFVSDNFGIAYKFDSGTGEVERTRPSLNLRPSNETLDRVNGVNKTKSGERVIPKTDIDSNYMSHDNTTVTIKDGGEGIELEINETTSGKAGIREALFEINNNTYNYEKVDISNEVSGGLKGEWKVVQDFLKYISLSENAPSRNQLKEELLKYFDEANVDKMLGNEEGLNRDIINPLREEINREIIELEKKKGDSEQLKLFKQIDQGEFIPVSKEAEAQAEAWYKSEKMKPLSDAVPFTNARNIVNNLAVGEFSEHGITLYKGSSMTDVYHESWHAFSQGFLTRDEKVSLYNDVRKLKGSFKSYTGETVKFSEATYLQIEEFLAEDFREFMINGQKYKRSLPARNSIFTKIWNFLKYIFGERNNRNQVTERMVNGKIKELYDNLSIGKFEGRTYSTENFMFDRLNKMSSGDSLIVMNPLKKSGNSLKDGRNSLNPTETKLVFDTMLHIFGNELQKKLTSLTPEQYKERQDIISKSKKSNTDLLKLHELYKQDSTDSSILSLAHDRDSLKEMFTSIKNEMESMSSNFSRIKNSLEQQGKESGYVQKSKINGLQENINLLDWAIENFGDLDKSFSNLVKDGGVVSYFLNNATEFFGSTDSQKESIIDLLSDEDSYQMEVGINPYGSASNEVDVNSRLSNELKAIFSTISKYDSNGKPEVNQFGIPKIENAEVIKNKLLSIVADSVDSQQFIERIMSGVLGVSKEGIIDSSSIDPTITELVNRIGHPNSTNLTTQMLWSHLYSAYNIKEVSIVSHLQEIEPADSNFDVVDIDEDGNPIKVEPRKNTKSVTKIINLDPATKSLGIAWENSFQRRKTKESKEYLEETYRNETVLNLQNVVLKDSLRWNVRMINKGGTEPVASPNPNHLSEFPEAKFLRSIGMDFPVNADAMSALKYSGDDNYHYYGIRQIINRLNDINNHNHWVAKLNKGKLIEIKSLRDIFAERSLLKSDGTFNPANSLDTYYKRILQLANKYTTSDQSHSVTTPDNKQIYTYTIPNSLITSLSLLNNEEHIKTYSDVIGDEGLKFFDNSVYPWANDSAIINSLFDMENGGIRRKDKHGNAVKIDYNYLMGIYTKYTENVNSLKKTESTKDISQKIGHVTFDEKFVSDFHNMIKNFSQETVRHADKSTYSYLGLSGVHNHITGEIDTHFATIDDFFTKSEDGSDNDAQARWKHYSRNKFYSESGRIAESIRLQKLVDENNKLQNKEDLYYSKRLLENGKNFVLLDGIISNTGIKEDIIKKIEKIVDDNPGVKDKTLFDIVKAELSSDVEILNKVDESFRSLQDRITSDVEERINKLSSEMETEGGMISDDIHSQILKLLREKGYSNKDQLLQEYKRYNRIPNDKQFESLSHKYSVRIASRMYAINSILGNMENTVMLYGDPAQYKNIDDLIKRSAGNASTGNIARTDAYIKELFNNTEEYSYRTKLMNDGVISKDLVATPWSNKFRTTVVKDVNTTSSYFEHLETLAKQIKDESKRKEYLRRIEAYRISENNGGMNIADAQAFISFDSYRKYSIAIGAWSNTQEMLYRKVVNGEEVSPFDVTEGFPILKLQYQGVIDNSLKSTNLPIMAQHKMSLAPIIPNEKGVKTNLDMLHEKMIREGIDYVVMESGSKMADYTKNGKLNEFYDGGNINGEEFIVQEIQLEYLKRQIEAHAESENDVSLASQMRKLIIDGLAEKGGFISGKEHLVENYMKSLDELVDAKMSDLEENAGITINNKVATSVDKTKFINYFLNRVGKSQLTQNEIEILEYMKGKKNPDLSYTFGSNRLQKMVANLIANDLIKMRVTGAFMVQRSSIGTEAAGEFNMDSYKGESTNETKKLFDNTLPYYRVVNGKTLPMGVKVSLSGDFRYLLKLKHNDGKEIGTRERLNEMIRNEEWLSKDDRRKMITMIGPRIPTQGHNSMEFMQIHEFLPSYNVNTIVLPREIVIKNGSDFDFDKLAIMKPNYSIQKNGYVINKSKLKEALSSKKTRDIVVSRDNVERVIDYLNNGGPIEELSSDAAMIYDLVIDNKGDTVVEYANGDDTAAKENRFFQSMIDILSDESIFMELVSPLDSEYLGGISNNLSPIDRNYKKEYNNFSDIVDYRYHLDRHEAFGLGRDSLGITSTFTTMKSMFNMIRYTLPEYVASGKENATGHDVDKMYKPLLDYIETTKGDNYDFKYDKSNPKNSGFFYQKELAATIRGNFRQRLLFKHNNRNGIDLSQLKGADKNANYNISDITNELMNGFLDMAKGDWVISINAVKESTPKLLFMLGAGMNPDVAISIISNPLIKRYTSMVSKNKSVMGEMFSEVQNTNKHARNMAVREILKGEGFNYSADFVTINNAENIALVLANGKLKGMFNEQSVIDRAVNPTEEITNLDRELFLHYMEIEKMSRQVNNFTTTFNLDTQKTSTIADILEKKASIDYLKNNLRIKEGLVNKMLFDTPVGKFFIQDIQLKVLGELFPFATDKTIVGRISKVQKKIDNHANTFVESFEADSFFASYSNTFKRLSYLANNPSKLQEMYSSHLLSYLFIEKLNGDLKSVPIIEEAGVKSLLSARDGIFVDETGQLHIDVKKILNEFKSESEGERFIYSEAFKEKYGVELDPKTEKGLFNNSLEYLRFIASLKVAEHKYPFNYEFLQSSGEFQAIRKYVLEKYSNDKTNHLDIFTDKGNPRSGEISYKSIYPEYIKSKALITSINFNKMFISDVSYVDILFNMIKRNPALSERFAFINDLVTEHSEYISDGTSINNLKMVEAFPSEEKINQYIKDIRDLISGNFTVKGMNQNQVTELSEFFSVLPVFSLFQSSLNINSAYSINKYIDPKLISDMISEVGNDFMKLNDTQKGDILRRFEPLFIRNNEKYYKSIRSQNYNDRPVAYERMSEAVSAILPKGSMFEMIRKSQHGDIGIYQDSAMSESIQQETLDMNGSFNFIIPSEIIGSSNEVINEGFVPEQIKFTDQKNKIVVQDFGKTENLFSSIAEARGMEKESLSSLIQKIDPATFVKINNKSTEIFNHVSRIYKIKSNSQTRKSVIEALNAYSQADNIFIIGDINKMKNPSNNPTIRKVNPEIFYVEGTGQYLTMLASESKRVFVYNDKPLKGIGTGWFEFNSTTGMFERMDVVNLPAIDQGKITATYSKPNVSKKAQNSLNRMFSSIDSPISLKVSEDVSNGAIDNFVEIPVRSNDPVLLENMRDVITDGKQELNPNYKIIVDNFIGDVKAKRINGLKPALPLNGIGGESGNNTLLGIQMENGKYQGQEGYAYLSKRLYEEFGYFNKDIVNLTKGTEFEYAPKVIDGDGKLITDDVLEEMKKQCK